MMSIRRISLALALTAGAVAGAGLRGAFSQSLPPIQQCYRTVDDPLDACSICANRCYSGNYKCCLIISA